MNSKAITIAGNIIEPGHKKIILLRSPEIYTQTKVVPPFVFYAVVFCIKFIIQ